MVVNVNENGLVLVHSSYRLHTVDEWTDASDFRINAPESTSNVHRDKPGAQLDVYNDAG